MLANGLSATRTGYFRITPRLGQALGARRHDVRLAQLVEQVGAHDADQLGGAGQPQDQRRDRQVLQQVPDLAPGSTARPAYSGENSPPMWALKNTKPK